MCANIKKERLPKGKYRLAHVEKTRSLQIVKNFGTNAYEIQLPLEIGISPIFNIADLTPFKVANEGIDIGHISDVEDIKDLPFKEAPKLKKILDTKVIK